MERPPLPVGLWLWSALNIAAYAVVVGFATAGTTLVVLIGSDHESIHLDDIARPAVYGGAAGIVVAVLVSLAQRRATVWAAPIVYGGVVAGWYAGTPELFLVPPFLLAVSGVLRAWYGRRYDPLLPLAARHWIGAGLTAVLVLLLAGTTALVAYRVQPTQAYLAMQDDPMGADDLPGLRVVSDHSTDQSQGVFGSTDATVSRRWAITDGARPRETIGRLAALATEAGWQAGDPATCPWQRTVDDIDLCLWVERSPGTRDIDVRLAERTAPDPDSPVS